MSLPASYRRLHRYLFFPKRFFPSSYAHTISTPTHTHSLTTNPGCSKYTNGQTPSKSLRLPLLTPPPSCKQAKIKKNGQKKQRHINVFTCPRVTFESPAVVCFFRTNFKVISEWLRVIVEEPRHDGGWRARGRRRRAAR